MVEKNAYTSFSLNKLYGSWASFNLPWYDCPSLFLVSVTWHAKGLSWTHQRNLQSTSKVLDACQAPWVVILHAFYMCICVLYGAVRNGKLTNLPLQIKIQKKKNHSMSLCIAVDIENISQDAPPLVSVLFCSSWIFIIHLFPTQTSFSYVHWYFFHLLKREWCKKRTIKT